MNLRSGPVCVAAALFWLSAALAPIAACAPAPKTIDIAICLDVSNSMDGLIGSAKAKLWDIVNDLAKVKPAPKLRVALFSYGHDGYDAKAGWVRKELDLTNDLDALYQKLFALSTRGGTEYVTRVCRDATEQLQWCADKDALKIIFVCGNEPASQDPLVQLKDAANKAKEKGIVINSIYCGHPEAPDAHDWKEFAKLCGGGFVSINQESGQVAITTPMDKQLTELSAKLNTTYLFYGVDGKDKQMNQAAQDANAFAAGGGVAAARSVTKANGCYTCPNWDIIDRMKQDPQFDVTKVPEKELCEELRKLAPEKRLGCVMEKAKEREGLQKQINELNAKRTEYICAEQKKNPSKADKAFDEAVRCTLRSQAAAKGIRIPE